jgi:CheY-specific phosphatase CheX
LLTLCARLAFEPSSTQMPPSATPSKNEDLSKRYGLEPVPESVIHLTRLVAQQDADIEEIGKLIVKDKSITARLLRFANPRAESEQDYDITSVDEALMRTGMAPVILLAMLDPLSRAVLKAFNMFQTQLTPTPADSLTQFSGEHVRGEVEFSGKGTGVVQVRLAPADAQRVASSVIGVRFEDLTSPAEIDDVIGELVNMIGGNLKSNLCDAGISTKLSAPRVSRTTDFRRQTVSGGVSERLGFASATLQTFVDASVNPWQD